MPYFQVLQGGAAASVRVFLFENDSIKAEADAMVSKTDNVILEAKLDGGILGGLARTYLTKESFFMQTLRCGTDGEKGTVRGPGTGTSGAETNYDGEVLVAPGEHGDITVLNIDPTATLNSNGADGCPIRAVYVAQGAYLCCGGGVNVNTSTPTSLTGAGHAMMSGAGFFIMKCSGRGPLALACLGACIRYDLAPGEERQVDNGHLVAWGDGVTYTVSMASRSVFGTMASGEGLMCNFKGPGPLWIQSHKNEESGGSDNQPKISSDRGMENVIQALPGGNLINKIIGIVMFFGFLGSNFGSPGEFWEAVTSFWSSMDSRPKKKKRKRGHIT